MAEQPSVSRVRVASAPPLPQVAGAMLHWGDSIGAGDDVEPRPFSAWPDGVREAVTGRDRHPPERDRSPGGLRRPESLHRALSEACLDDPQVYRNTTRRSVWQVVGGKRPAARSRLVGRVLSPSARFAHDSNMGSTNVTDGMGPRQYILLYTYVVGYPTCLWISCATQRNHTAPSPFIIQPRASPPACNTRCQDAGG
jgi:hypothetical protein